MEKVERLLAELREHTEAQELLKEHGTIETMSDFAEVILSFAQRLGIETDVDAPELVGYLESMEASQRDSTEQAADALHELEDSDLENVAGGKGHSPSHHSCGQSMSEAFDHAFECWSNDKCATFLWN